MYLNDAALLIATHHQNIQPKTNPRASFMIQRLYARGRLEAATMQSHLRAVRASFRRVVGVARCWLTEDGSPLER